jgi:hypothetical protein
MHGDDPNDGVPKHGRIGIWVTSFGRFHIWPGKFDHWQALTSIRNDGRNSDKARFTPCALIL